jgi:hypothetical protein
VYCTGTDLSTLFLFFPLQKLKVVEGCHPYRAALEKITHKRKEEDHITHGSRQADAAGWDLGEE